MPQNLKLLGPTANGEKAKQVHKLTADLICAPVNKGGNVLTKSSTAV